MPTISHFLTAWDRDFLVTMNVVVLALLVCLFIVTASTSAATPITKRSSRFDKFIQKLFDNADTNRDDDIDFGELYELVLQMYVKLNRQAPIPPPTRSEVLQLYKHTDRNHDRTVGRDEFTELATLLGKQALIRLVAHKMVTLVGAPILAHYVVLHWVNPWWMKVAVKVIPTKWVPWVTNPALTRTIVMVVFVASLGNLVMSAVDWILDMNLIGKNTNDHQKTTTSSFLNFTKDPKY